MENTEPTRVQDWFTLLLGVWLFFTPFFGYGTMTEASAFNGFIFGAIIVVLSIMALFQPRVWEEWLNIAIGVWLIFAPFAFGYAAGFLVWNSIIVGLLVAVVAVSAMYRSIRTMGPPTHHVPHHT